MTYDPPLRGWRTPRSSVPRVSVIVPAYNAARYVRQSVDSILGQTYTDFELIVVDDCSTDDTAAILAGYDDPRLRVVRSDRNLGVVEARNRAWEHARGEYIAAFDADDVSLPTRLAKQVAFLDANPSVALVSTETLYLEAGMLRPGHRVVHPTPTLMRWILNVSNPFAHPALMYRASTIRRLGVLLREECKYAEDFDLYHRIARTDEVALLDEPLVLYRRHPGAITCKHEPEMIAAAGRVLAGVYRDGFGPEADAAAALVAKHVLAAKPPESEAVLVRLGAVLSRLVQGFLGAHEASPGWTDADREAVLGHASDLWWRAVRSAVRSGRLNALAVAPPDFAAARRDAFPRSQVPVSVVSGLVPFKKQLRPMLEAARGTAAKAVAPAPGRVRATSLFGIEYKPLPDDERPPTLYVVVDAGAAPGAGGRPGPSGSDPAAVAAVGRGQEIFDRYGLRPVYLVDHATASRPAVHRPLRAIHDRGGCEIGALLHPSSDPSLEARRSVRVPRAGDFPPDREERDLEALLDAIRRGFHVAPLSFKAGRGCFGPNTMETVARHGIRLDLSVVPGRDDRPAGGPDFRGFDSAPRSLLDGRLLCVPMTRGPIGPLSAFAGTAARADASGVPGALSGLGLLETVELAPERVPAGKQIALIRAMLARGERCFVLHYHGASLAPGHTPGARTPDDANEVSRKLDQVCHFFFETLGGVPGTLSDLLPPPLRAPGRPARDRQAGLTHGPRPTGARAGAADAPDGN